MVMRRFFHLLAAGVLLVALAATPAGAQGARPGSGALEVDGFALFGNMRFTASDSFEAVLDRSSGPVFGGGGRVTLPVGVFVEVAAWRFSADGERVFVATGNQVFKLGIPTSVTITPVEVTGGWRFRHMFPRVVPYVGVGWSSYAYRETSDFAAAGEDVDERFSGVHLVTGADVRVQTWLHVGGEIAIASVPDALGAAGVSSVYNEKALGGTSLRLKIRIGR
ncbi:MAG: hypothetical protein AB1635_06910 [Acidobacteriota bacterium]